MTAVLKRAPGIVALILISRFISYALKAGQIAMMTRGVSEGELPDNVIKEGRRVVKERFATVAAFFAITGVIRGIFNQIGRGVTKLGESIGGDTGGAIGGLERFGKNAMLSAQKTMNRQGTMKVIHANDMIPEIFEVTVFSDILTLE